MDEPAETRHCKNCNQDIPVNNWSMHTLHCERHLARCPHCKDPVNKQLLEKHIEENHIKVNCDKCRERVEIGKMESHKENSCEQRSVECPYCELLLAASDMTEHKDTCGCRTEKCEKCGTRVMHKDQVQHEKSGCGMARGRVPRYHEENELKHKEQTQQKTPDNRAFPARHSDIDSFLRFFPPQEQYFKARHGPEDSVKVTSNLVDEKPPADETYVKRPVNNRQEKVSNFEQQQSSGGTSGYRKPRKKPKRYQQTYESAEGEILGRDLTDDTFLPCEICDTLLPADALAVHQAVCVQENSFSTHGRKRSPEKYSSPKKASPVRTRREQRFSPKEERLPSSFNNLKLDDSAKLNQATAVVFSSTRNDVEEETAPCEICMKPIPLYQLGVHQVVCFNDNSKVSQFTSQSRKHSSLDNSTHNVPQEHTPKTDPAPKALKATGKSKLAIRFGNEESCGTEQPVFFKSQIKILDEFRKVEQDERSQEREVTRKQQHNQKQTVERAQTTKFSQKSVENVDDHLGDGVRFGKNATTSVKSHAEGVRKAYDRKTQDVHHNGHSNKRGGAHNRGSPQRRGTPQNRGGPNRRGGSRGGTRTTSRGSSTITVKNPPQNQAVNDSRKSEDSQANSFAAGSVKKTRGKIVTLDQVVHSSGSTRNPSEQNDTMSLLGIGLNGRTTTQHGHDNMGSGYGRRLGGSPRGGRGSSRGGGPHRGGSRPRGGNRPRPQSSTTK